MKLNKVLMLTFCIGALVFTSCKKDTDVIQLKVSEMEISVMGHQKIEVAKALPALTKKAMYSVYPKARPSLPLL